MHHNGLHGATSELCADAVGVLMYMTCGPKKQRAAILDNPVIQYDSHAAYQLCGRSDVQGTLYLVHLSVCLWRPNNKICYCH